MRELRKNIFVLIRIFAAILSMEIYTLVPVSKQTYKFFPYVDQRLTLQSWIDYASTRVGFLILLYQLYLLLPKFREHLFIINLLAAGYIVDYFLRYNLPVEGPIPFVSYTTFMIVCFIAILGRTYMELKKKTDE